MNIWEGWEDGWRVGLVGACLDSWMDGSDRWVIGWVYGWVDRWVDYMDGWTGGVTIWMGGPVG